METTEVIVWIAFSAVCYRLREFKMWGDGNSWWMCRKTPTLFDKLTFKFFFDSYHFFGNLARILVSLRLAFISIELSAIAFSAWNLSEYITKQIITQTKRKES